MSAYDYKHLVMDAINYHHISKYIISSLRSPAFIKNNAEFETVCGFEIYGIDSLGKLNDIIDYIKQELPTNFKWGGDPTDVCVDYICNKNSVNLGSGNLDIIQSIQLIFYYKRRD